MKQKKSDPYLDDLDELDDLGEEEPIPTESDEKTHVDLEAPFSPESEDEEESGEMEEEVVELPESPRSTSSQEVLSLAPDIPVQMVVVLGRKSVTVKDLVQLKMGQVIEMDKMSSEAVDLVAAGKVIGKGELVQVDGKLGVRILKLNKK